MPTYPNYSSTSTASSNVISWMPLVTLASSPSRFSSNSLFASAFLRSLCFLEALLSLASSSVSSPSERNPPSGPAVY